MTSKISVVIEFDLNVTPDSSKEAILMKHSVSKQLADFIERKVYQSTTLKAISITKVGAQPNDSYTMAELDEVNWFQKDQY